MLYYCRALHNVAAAREKGAQSARNAMGNGSARELGIILGAGRENLRLLFKPDFIAVLVIPQSFLFICQLR